MKQNKVSLEADTYPVLVRLTAKPGDKIVVLHGSVVAVIEAGRSAAPHNPAPAREGPGRGSTFAGLPTRDAIAEFLAGQPLSVSIGLIAASLMDTGLPKEGGLRSALSFRLGEMVRAGTIIRDGGGSAARYTVPKPKPAPKPKPTRKPANKPNRRK